MGGMKVSELEFLRLLPAFMRDDEAAIALSKAINRLIGEPSKRLKTLRVWDNIDNLNEAECDELAWELDVDWYDSIGMSLSEKRATIKAVQQIKRKRGTKWSIEELITSAFGMGRVSPWYAYGGYPFGFKIQTNATLRKDGMTYFLSMIDKVKSTRDHIDEIEIIRTTNQTIHTGTAQFSHSKCVILDNFHETRYSHLKQYSGVAGKLQIYTAVIEGSTETQIQHSTIGTKFLQIYYTKNTIKED